MINSQDIKTLLGKRIQFYRKLRQLSQATLSEEIDISIVALGQIERGVRYPTAETLSRIINSLQIDISELFVESKMPEGNRNLLNRFKNDVIKSVLNSVQKSVQKSVEAVYTKYEE